MADNEIEIYKIFQVILNTVLQMFNLASSLKNNFFFLQVRFGWEQDLTMERHRFVLLSQQILSQNKFSFQLCKKSI